MKARLLIILVFLPALSRAYGQGATDNTIHVKQFPGVDVGSKVAAAMGSCNPDANVPCILVIDPSLATAARGTMPTLCAQCTLQDYRAPGALPPFTLPGTAIADKFTGADCGAKINAAFASFTAARTPGTAFVSQACGSAPLTITVPIVIPAGDSLVFSQGGVYSFAAGAGITMRANTALYSLTPQAPDAGPVVLKAADGAGLSAIVTVSGPSAVVHDLTINGNASTIGRCGNNGGTVDAGLSGGLVYVTSAGGRFEMERTEVKCGAGVGVNNLAQNTDLSHVEVLYNMKQGYLCTNTADDWVSQDSQFEQNGFSGIELNGCSSTRVLHADVSMNGQSASSTALSTGCDIYVHGSAGHVSNSNIFVQVQGGSKTSLICDIGTSQTSYSNSYIGFQSLGSTVGGQPLVYVKDGASHVFEGTEQLGAANWGIKFEESRAGAATPSTARINFANLFTASNAWSDGVRYPDDFTGSIVGNNAAYQLGPSIKCNYLAADNTCTVTALANNAPASASYTNNAIMNFMAPNLQTGGYQAGMQIGQASNTNYQSAILRFTYQGNGSTSNKATFGVYGASGLTIDGAGNITTPKGYTGSKTAGSCVLTITSGLITNVSGC